MKKENVLRKINGIMFRNWKNLLLIITFDVLFVLLISNLRFIQISIDNIFFPLFVNKTAKLMYSITYVIFELFLVIFTYSFFKFIVMGFIQKSFKKSEFNLKGFFYFFKLNLIIIMPLIILFVLVLNLIIKYFNNLLSVGGIDPFKFVFIVLAIGILFFVLFIYFYTFINILHFSFLKEQKIKRLIKSSLLRSWKLNFYGVYWENSKIVFMFAIFMLIIHFFAKSFVFNNFSLYVKNFGTYRAFIYWMISLVAYFLLLLNRFIFYVNVFGYSKMIEK